MRHLVECFLGTRPKGEIRKCLNGGKGKGPAVWPLRTLVKRFCSRMSGCRLAERRLG